MVQTSSLHLTVLANSLLKYFKNTKHVPCSSDLFSGMIQALKGVRHMNSSAVKQAVSELSVPVHGEKSEVKSGVLIMDVLCCVFMAGLITVAHSTPSSPCCPKKEMPKVIKQGMDEMLQFEKKAEEKKSRVYSYDQAADRLSAVNPTLSEQSVRILLERGLVQVEGGFVFSRDFRINLKNIVRISLEQSLEMQSRIKASVLVVLAEGGFEKIFAEPDQKKFTSALLQAYRDTNHTVVRVPGDHHVHLNDPEAVAPLVSDFLQTKVLTRSDRLTDVPTSKL
ncbi:hypothetical protein INR49_030940 [Caranx melampygus]|nr:hypothetical protein INR49_030940 [Caranx melampygus]